MGMTVTGIYRYPVKSCRGEWLPAACVEPWGLAGDRRWMIVDDDGLVLTARERPPLLLVTPVVEPDAIRLTAPGLPELTVSIPSVRRDRDLVPVVVWDSKLVATPTGEEVGNWLSAVAGEPVRLVYLDDPTRRRTNPAYSRDTDRVSFADGYPLLLTSTGSLDELNRWLTGDGERAVPMTRFRPSAVVAGAPPWAEDRWRRVRVGSVVMRVVKPCGRCVVTTIDQITGERGSQPLKMLGRHRNIGRQLVFGQNLIPDSGGVIRVGDQVEILSSR